VPPALTPLVGTRIERGEAAYSSADAMLYALSLGVGDEPLDVRQLRYVYEENLRTLPTLPLVLGWQGIWMPSTQRALDYPQMLHAEERLQCHRPLPPAGIVRDEVWLDALVDRGAGRGVFVHTRKELFSENDGLPLATVHSCVLARGDGGGGSAGAPPVPLQATPARAPDHVASRRTLARQALLYRLNGDSNPVHGAPATAALAGFDRPLLHGRCTLGLALREALAQCCDYAADDIVAVQTRFAAPFFPGETLRVNLWQDGRAIAFSADVVERELTVLSHGRIELRA
jgi:acyl dehydratase